MKLCTIRALSAKGAVLLLCLLLLTSLGLLGLAAASDYLLQTRMTGNVQVQSAAAQSAESALAWGESWLFGLPGESRLIACEATCEPGQVIRASGGHGPRPEQRDFEWWRQNAFRAGLDPVTGEILDGYVAGLTGGGYWLIEEAHLQPESGDGFLPEIAFYRLIARGLSQETGSWSVVESIIARPWGQPELTEPFPALLGQASLCSHLVQDAPCGRLAWRRHH